MANEKKTGASKSKGIRFICPEHDIDILAWSKVQRNLSFSIRVALKDFIARYGVTDAMDLLIRNAFAGQQSLDRQAVQNIPNTVMEQHVRPIDEKIEKPEKTEVQESRPEPAPEEKAPEPVAEKSDIQITAGDNQSASDMLADMLR